MSDLTVKVLTELLSNDMIEETHHIAERENVNTTEDIARELLKEYNSLANEQLETTESALPIDGVSESFSVHSLSVSKQDYHHWAEGLTLFIAKNGVNMKLNGEEAQQIIQALPRTIGGVY